MLLPCALKGAASLFTSSKESDATLAQELQAAGRILQSQQ